MTKKRFVKKCMGLSYHRNEANDMANAFCKEKVSYDRGYHTALFGMAVVKGFARIASSFRKTAISCENMIDALQNFGGSTTNE